MNQSERRVFLLTALLKERPEYAEIPVPVDAEAQKRLLRGLMNVRPPRPVPEEVLSVQDAYLREELARRGVTDAETLLPAPCGICLWQGDITTLRCSAIVNAANSAMLGCFVPCHGCIDNAIHTRAGMQLRLECFRQMQGREEPTGTARLTPAYNLPCDYVLHTVGPTVAQRPTQRDRALLASCYRSCLMLAEARKLPSIAFCCISTGEFHYPPEEAAQIAVDTVEAFLRQTQSKMKVIFNVFKDRDREIYRRILYAAEAGA